MAKESYRIRDSLDKNHGDIEINLSSEKTGLSLRPIPIKIIGCWILSILLLFLILSKSFISAGGIGWCICFSILWGILTFILLQRDKTNRPQYTLLESMIEYLPKRMRNVYTRKTSNPYDLYDIVGIDDIDQDRGMFYFNDGTVGNMYSVVGNASRLLFDRDRDEIVDRVDGFYRKMESDYEIIFITAKASQNVYSQLGALQRREINLTTDDEDIRALIDTQKSFLINDVGTSFKSIHQYMILKANNEEALALARTMVFRECEDSQLMFSQLKGLFDEDLMAVLKLIFRGEN